MSSTGNNNPFGNPFAEEEEEQQTLEDEENIINEEEEEEVLQDEEDGFGEEGLNQGEQEAEEKEVTQPAADDEEEGVTACHQEENEGEIDNGEGSPLQVGTATEEDCCDDDINYQEEEEGNIEGGEEYAAASEAPVHDCTEEVEERLEEANIEFSTEQLVFAQSTILKLQAENEVLTTTNAINCAKLEASEKELQVVKMALAQMQQVMASAAAAAATTAGGGEGQPSATISAPQSTPSFDAVELALELETTDRKLLQANFAAERAAAMSTKWEEEAKRYAGMYHDAVAGRYVPLLSDHGAAIVSKNNSTGAGTRVVAYFSELLLNGPHSSFIANDDENTAEAFTKPQREVLLDYILACGYELQFMMMRANVMMNNTTTTTPSSAIIVGNKRPREDTITPLSSPSIMPSGSATAAPLSLPATGRTISVKQGLLGELIQELTASPSSSAGSGGQKSSNKWEFAETQISTASTTTINALRSHVSQFDSLETSVKALHKKMSDAKSLSANPLFNLTWDNSNNDDSKNNVSADRLIVTQQEGEEEMRILRGKNKLLVGACRLYYRRSQQLLEELTQLRGTSITTTTTTAAVIGGAIASANIVSAYAEGLGRVRCAYAQTMENIALDVTAKFATLSTVHNAYVQGISQHQGNEDEDEEEEENGERVVKGGNSRDASIIVSDLATFIQVGHQTTTALREAVIAATNEHLAGPLNATTTQYHRDIAVFARLLSEADDVVQQGMALEEGGSGGGLTAAPIQIEQFQALVEGILHQTPNMVPSVHLPTTLITPTTTSPTSDIVELVRAVSSQCASSIITAHETANKLNNDRLEFTLNKVAALLGSSSGGGAAALLLRDLQDTQSAHRTANSELLATTNKLNEVNSKLQLALQSHEKAKVNCENEAKSHSEARIMLQNSQNLLSKNQTLSQAQLADQKSKYEGDIAKMDETLQKLKDDYAILQAQLADAVQEAADYVAAMKAKEEVVEEAVDDQQQHDEEEVEGQQGEEGEGGEDVIEGVGNDEEEGDNEEAYEEGDNEEEEQQEGGEEQQEGVEEQQEGGEEQEQQDDPTSEQQEEGNTAGNEE